MVVNKRGWIKILEATIAVLIVSGVLVVVYSRQMSETADPGEYIYNLQKKILRDISLRNDLRSYVLKENVSALEDYVKGKIPTAFSYSLKVCNFTSPPTPCKLNSTEFIATRNNDIYVEEGIISADLADYDPKKVKLFVWENR